MDGWMDATMACRMVGAELRSSPPASAFGNSKSIISKYYLSLLDDVGKAGPLLPWFAQTAVNIGDAGFWFEFDAG
jgi:hypothetical protein